MYMTNEFLKEFEIAKKELQDLSDDYLASFKKEFLVALMICIKERIADLSDENLLKGGLEKDFYEIIRSHSPFFQAIFLPEFLKIYEREFEDKEFPSTNKIIRMFQELSSSSGIPLSEILQPRNIEEVITGIEADGIKLIGIFVKETFYFELFHLELETVVSFNLEKNIVLHPKVPPIDLNELKEAFFQLKESLNSFDELIDFSVYRATKSQRY